MPSACRLSAFSHLTAIVLKLITDFEHDAITKVGFYVVMFIHHTAYIIGTQHESMTIEILLSKPHPHTDTCIKEKKLMKNITTDISIPERHTSS